MLILQKKQQYFFHNDLLWLGLLMYASRPNSLDVYLLIKVCETVRHTTVRSPGYIQRLHHVEWLLYDAGYSAVRMISRRICAIIVIRN